MSNPLEEYINSIPKEAQQILLSLGVDNTVSEIGTRYHFTEVQKNRLSFAVWNTLLDIYTQEEFVEHVKKLGAISDKEVEEILGLAEEQIFTKLRNVVGAGSSVPKTPTENNNLEKTKLNNTFISKPTTRQIEINEEKPDPYLEPINESDTI